MCTGKILALQSVSQSFGVKGTRGVLLSVQSNSNHVSQHGNILFVNQHFEDKVTGSLQAPENKIFLFYSILCGVSDVTIKPF
jgi:hypothetical protein